MDNLGSYIYILFILIAIVRVIMEATKKKGENASSEPARPKQVTTYPSSWEDLLGDVMKKTEPKDIPAKSPVAIKVQKSPSMPTKKAPSSISNRIAAQNNTTELRPSNKQETTPYFANANDLRRAIITAEILQKKF